MGNAENMLKIVSGARGSLNTTYVVRKLCNMQARTITVLLCLKILIHEHTIQSKMKVFLGPGKPFFVKNN